MSKTYHPSIRNGKPVLVEETNRKKPDYTKYDVGADYMKDLADYEAHIANLEVLEVSKELLDVFPECWYQEWGFYDGKQIEVFYPEGHTGKWPLEEGVDFNITRPFHLEGTQRVEKLVAILRPATTEIKTITATIPEEDLVQALYRLGKALSIIQEKREKQAGLGGLEHCIRPAYDLLNNLLNKK